MSEIRASIRRHWPMVLVVVLLIPIVMAIYLAGREVVRPPARFTISADVLIPARDEAGGAPENVPPVLLQGQTELASAPDTKRAALETAGVEPDAVGGLTLSGRLNDNQSIMTLQVSAPSPEAAAAVLDGYISAYEEGRRESVRDAALELQDIQRRTVAVLERRVAEVEAELLDHDVPLPRLVADTDPVPVPADTASDDILLAYERNALLNERQRRQVDYALQSTRAEIPGRFSVVVQRRATSRITPPPPSPLVPLLQILAVGLVLAIGIPVARDRFDRTITEAKAVPGTFRTGVLATFPAMPKRLQHQLAPPGSTWDMSFRALAATSISTDRLPKAIMVTSPSGTTQDYVAANFAAGLAGLGVTVALIGTSASQSWYAQDEETAGGPPVGATPGAPHAVGPTATATALAPASFPELLEDGMAGRLEGDLRGRLTPLERPNLYVVPPAEGSPELALDGLPPLLDALSRSEIDIVVLAGPPFLSDPNATIMAWSTRHVLWAIELGQVNKVDAQLAADRLDLAGVEPFGVALLKRHAHRS